MNKQLESLIDSNITNLTIFQQKYGNIRQNIKEKKDLKVHIENTTNYIKTLINSEYLEGIDEKVSEIQKLKILCLPVDHDIFNNLIKVLQECQKIKNKSDKTGGAKKKNNNYNNIQEDVTMQVETGNQNNEGYKYQQTYLQANKQLVKQKISEEYTNDMLGRAISKAEHFSSRFGKKQMEQHFNYYNRFDNGFTKDKENLKKSLINALDTLQDYYEMDGPKKKFSKNFNQTKIVNYIKQLKSNCSDEDKIIFDDFINILMGGDHINFDEYFNSNCKVDPKVLTTNGISSMKFAAKQEKEWKEKAMKKGDYNVELKIDQNWNTNPHIPNQLKNHDYGSFC